MQDTQPKLNQRDRTSGHGYVVGARVLAVLIVVTGLAYLFVPASAINEAGCRVPTIVDLLAGSTCFGTPRRLSKGAVFLLTGGILWLVAPTALIPPSRARASGDLDDDARADREPTRRPVGMANPLILLLSLAVAGVSFLFGLVVGLDASGALAVAVLGGATSIAATTVPTGEGVTWRRPGLIVVTAVIVIASASGLLLLRFTTAKAAEIATGFADAWERADWSRLNDFLSEPGNESPADTFALVYDDLDVESATVAVRDVFTDGSAASASLDVRLQLRALDLWRYETRLPLERSGLGWKIVWSPSLVHPGLTAGARLRRETEWPARAAILDRHGDPITVAGTVVSVGLEPRRIVDRDETLAALERELAIDPSDATSALDRPGVQPEWFVPLVDLREERYQELRPRLAPIPGVVFKRKDARLLPAQGFAVHVVGRTGPITAELLDRLGPPYDASDEVGRSGLELAFERRLAGGPKTEIVARDGEQRTLLHTFPMSSPDPVRTTLDLTVQRAAEQAAEGVTEPMALVAVDAASSEIRASVSRPLDVALNRAFAGRYPPGSTFKIVTAAALLGRELSPSETVDCPAEAVVGRPIRNAGGRDLGSITFERAFAESCNTSFALLSRRLDPQDLVAAAERFGFGAGYEMPLPVAGGRLGSPKSAAEHAATAIGQGTVLASPLHMATVAAAVASGGWRPPILVQDQGRPDVQPLDHRIAEALRRLMTTAVREGTGTAASLPGHAVAGKTGTAEFVTEDGLGEHAWFVGFRGGLAFAVLVEGGGSGAATAAPIAARFLSSLGT